MPYLNLYISRKTKEELDALIELRRIEKPSPFFAEIVHSVYEEEMCEETLTKQIAELERQRKTVEKIRMMRAKEKEESDNKLMEILESYRRKTKGKIREERSPQENKDILLFVEGRPEWKPSFPGKNSGQIMDQLDAMMRSET